MLVLLLAVGNQRRVVPLDKDKRITVVSLEMRLLKKEEEEKENESSLAGRRREKERGGIGAGINCRLIRMLGLGC